jgi:predicted transcriptional regulator
VATEHQTELLRGTRETILEVIIRSPGCSLEEVVVECTDLTWNQVFCEVDPA